MRIAGALIAFFVTTGFAGPSHGGDAGSNRGSDTAALSASGNPVGGHEAAGMTAVRFCQGNRDAENISGFSRMFRQGMVKNGLASVPCSDNNLRIFT